MNNAPEFYAANRSAWHDWLEKHHASEQAVWLVYDKGKDRSLSWSEIVDEALCYGWIDSRPGKVSDTKSKLYICKRKPKSVWSSINKAKVEELIGSGRMQPAGLEAIRIAKENGSWDLLNLSDNLVIPQELEALFINNPTAKANFEAFPRSSKKNMLAWIYEAKREETKRERIQKTFDLAAQNIRIR